MPNNETIHWKETTPESDTTDNQTTNEQAANKQSVMNRQLGSKALSSAGFETRNKEVVDSSYDKARKRGEKLPGKNNERRNYAYLSRLENLIDKYGNDIEKRLWQASENKLVIKPEDIQESYWQTQEQILRDNGQGRTLNKHEKSILTEDIQKQQIESLKSWSNYLGDERSPYPLWFKIYAWDGMSKMGVFDKEKGYFKKRDNHTVAPYPKLNPAVLAKTYNVVADFYGFEEEGKARYEEDETRNEVLKGLAKSGNFNKLYSKILLNEKAIPKTPERTEDVHGEWLEYLPGEEEKLASAAEGTPWCVADPGTGRNYLEYGSYAGNDYDEYDDDYEYADSHNSNQAKFILFHLYDPEKNTLSETACASIRLNPDGNVAEISGLNEGQALEDFLVPIVEEKVKSLPDGEKFLEAFKDKQELIRLDRKMQNDEDLTKEELEFIYEINRPIKTLDTYNETDPRIDELKEKYSIDYALDAGVDADMLASRFNSDGIIKKLDTLISHGADIDIDNLVSNLEPYMIIDNLDALINHGANIDGTVSHLRYDDIVDNLDTLINHGANIDDVVSRFRYNDIANNLDTLISHGINIDNIVSHLNSSDIVKNLDALINHGANINNIVSNLDSYDITDNLDTLISHGANIDNIVLRLHSNYIVKNLDALIEHGANINNIISRLEPDQIDDNLYILIEHGANINDIVSRLGSHYVAKNLNILINHGANINIDDLASHLSYRDIVNNLDSLRRHGYNINIDDLASRLSYRDIVNNLDSLRRHGYTG